MMREGCLDDLDRIMELEIACFREDAFSRRQYRYLLQSPACRIVLCEEGDVLQGMLVLTWRAGASIMRIYSIAVASEVQGKGMGTQLMREAIDCARQMKRQWLLLEVGVNNGPAIRLYHKFGFQEITRLPSYYGSGRDAWRMAARVELELVQGNS